MGAGGRLGTQRHLTPSPSRQLPELALLISTYLRHTLQTALYPLRWRDIYVTHTHTPAKAQGTQWRESRKSVRSDREEGRETLSPGHSMAVTHMSSTTLATFTRPARDQAGYIVFFF